MGGVGVSTHRMGEGPVWSEAGREGPWRKRHTRCPFNKRKPLPAPPSPRTGSPQGGASPGSRGIG